MGPEPVNNSESATLSRLTVVLALLFLIPIFSPLSNVSGEPRIESQDFGVLEELDQLLGERGEFLSSNSVSQSVEPKIEAIKQSVSSSDGTNPISHAGPSLDGLSIVQTTPPEPMHPAPYGLLLDGSSRPPGFVENIWQTLFNITDYVIWTQFEDKEGNITEQIEVVSFSASLLSILNTNTEALLHSVDVDGDGDDDIQVGLKVDVEFVGGWGIEGDTLWIEPGIEFTVQELGGSSSDPDWENLESLTVSLVKAFTYSDSGTILNLGEGETYVWVIDSRFTMPPNDFTFEVGIERFFFDISEAALGFGQALLTLLTLGLGDSPSESGISFAAISSPYSLRFDNRGQDRCSESYNTSELYTMSSLDISCGVSAGFGYVHFSPPDDNSNRRMWELAYLEARFHPHSESDRLPSEAEVVVRTDSVLPSSTGLAGEKSLTSIEYWADRRSDLYIHFHEDRSNLPQSQSDGSYGNKTDSVGWLRGMPAGSLSEGEIERVFRMLGSADQPELPGSLPNRLGMIIAVKNFTRDSSQNVDDPTLPINPANPPDSLVIIRSVESIKELDYDSWFSRAGYEHDHRKIRVYAEDIPSAIAVYGSFGLGGSSESDESVDSPENLDFISKIVDSVILNVVDLFLEVGNVLNNIPSTIVEVLSGGAVSGDLSGREIYLLMTDNWLESRTKLPMSRLSMQIGSSDHPILEGNHLLLAKDEGLGKIQTDYGLKDPLVPVAASLNFSGIQSFSFADTNSSSGQEFSLNAVSDESIQMTYIGHKSGSMEPTEYQSAWFSDLPNNISIFSSDNGVEFISSSPIDSIVYTGFDGLQRQAGRITGFPSEFSSTTGTVISWSSNTPIELIEAQLSDSSDPLTMSGDHFLFHHDPESNTSSLSSTVSGLSEIGWIPPIEQGASGSSGLGTAFATIDGGKAMKISIGNAPTLEQLPLSVLAEIDPLPSSLSVKIPTESRGGPSLEIPEFNSSMGMSGVALFISGFSDLGKSINGVLSGITNDISTGSQSQNSNFSFSLELDANSEFDLIVESSMGSDSIEEPEWVHGISLASSPSGIEEGFHLKTWVPNLPAQVDLSLSRNNIPNGESFAIRIGLDGWRPHNSEFIIATRGVNGQDLFVTLEGLEVGQPTSVLLDSVFRIETVSGITKTSISSLYSMSNRLDWFHAQVIDRQVGSRTEMMVQDIPESVEIEASIGTAISMDVTVPEQYRKGDIGVGSIMIQQMQWMDKAWWPATMFLTQVPGSMNLTTEPDLDFDITKSLTFQGLPILDFSASSDGMSLYIDATGRSINSKGNVTLMAEGLSDRLSVKPTESFGLNIRSGGDGVDRLYFRASDIPTYPPVTLDEMEALGEGLKSATIQIHEIGRFTPELPGYQLIEVSDVQGGRIIISARVSAELSGINADLRGVMLDAQITEGIPSGTTLGVNGFASDLSLLNKIPGLSGSTSHWMAVEPVSSGILTVIATIGGGSDG